MSEPTSKPVTYEVFPILRVRGAAAAIEHYTHVFGAEEIFRLTEPTGRIGHCELKLGNVTLMLSEEYPEMGLLSPLAYEGNGASLHLHVDDVDALAKRAAAAGATITMEPADQFYGERSCRLRDPFGHDWLIGHQLEALTPEEMQRRYDALFDK